MKKIAKLLVPALIAVVLFGACEDQMDELTVQEVLTEMPPKSKIKLPPGYVEDSTNEESDSGE
ncbi:hypothetical protein [Nafulsella turpanensis]|uniref:hypothetical protein n=1 Tax=Nafulsella turpanensis TaxID=1265690 RepID=UPI00034A20ED|nr:hypothetical protein [Nafulsella turpanensis]